jgi:hypothetical protein
MKLHCHKNLRVLTGPHGSMKEPRDPEPIRMMWSKEKSFTAVGLFETMWRPMIRHPFSTVTRKLNVSGRIMI